MFMLEPASGSDRVTVNRCTVSRPRCRVCGKARLQTLMEDIVEEMGGEVAPEQTVSLIARAGSDQIQIMELRRLVLECRRFAFDGRCEVISLRK